MITNLTWDNLIKIDLTKFKQYIIIKSKMLGYIGSKKSLLPFLDDVMKDVIIEHTSFADRLKDKVCYYTNGS